MKPVKKTAFETQNPGSHTLRHWLNPFIEPMRFLSTLTFLTILCLPLWANYPLFEHSKTFQEWVTTGLGSQIITLKRYESGKRASAWKIEGFFASDDTSQGTLLLYNEKGALVHQVQGYFSTNTFIPHGKWILLGERAPKLTAHFHEGELEGEMILFNEQGQIKCRKNFSKGICHGPYLLLNEEGEATEQGYFDQGYLNGSIWRFDNEGNVIEELPFLKGLPHGLCLSLDYKKKCQIRRYFVHGFLHRMDGPALEIVRSNQSHALSANYRFSQPYGLWIYKDNQSLPHIMLEWKANGEAFAYSKQNPSKKWFWKKGILQAPCNFENSELKRFSHLSLKKDHLELVRLLPSSPTPALSHWKILPNEKLVREGIHKYMDPLKNEIVIETWKEGSLLQKSDEKGSLIEKRSTHTSLRLYQKNELTLEIQDPKTGSFLRAHFNKEGTLGFLNSTPLGWQQENGYQAYKSDKSFMSWEEQDNFLKLTFENQQSPYIQESYLFEDNVLLKHCLWSEEGPEGNWSEQTADLKPVDERYFEKGRLEGAYKFFHSNGKLAYEGFYQKGLPIKTHRKFHPCGKLAFSQEYKEGRASGLCQKWDEEGNICLKAHFENDLLNGAFWQKLSKGQIIETCFKRGRLDGPLKAYYPATENKKMPIVAFKGHYKKGKREGDFFDYHESGKLIRQSHYEQNKLEGALIHFHLNSQKALLSHYHQGYKEGTWETFNEKGILLRHAEFKKDLLEGKELIYDEQGHLLGENNYLHNSLHGEQKRYEPSGGLIYEAHYVHGKLHGAVRKYQKETQSWKTSHFENGELIKKQKEDKEDKVF